MNVIKAEQSYNEIIQMNNTGVNYLYSGNIKCAFVAFQDATILARNAMILEQQALMCSLTDPMHSKQGTSKETTTVSIHPDVECYVSDDDDLSTMSDYDMGQSISTDGCHRLKKGGIRCIPGEKLRGMDDEGHYIFDRPFLFCYNNQDGNYSNFEDPSIANANGSLILLIVITLNFALTCHYFAKLYGKGQSYLAAIELYYLAWSISQNCCQADSIFDVHFAFTMMDGYCYNEWHANIQYIALNNLVLVHDELNSYQESEICMTCLRELIIRNSVFWRRTDMIHQHQLISRNEFERIKLNLLYFRKPNTARAA